MTSHGVPRAVGQEPRSAANTQKELEEIKKYNELVEQVNKSISRKQYDVTAFSLTARLLQKNPEYYTVWNYRGRILINGLFKEDNPAFDQDQDQGNAKIRALIDQDLRFLLPLLQKYPKCYWIWNYRTWLLTQAIALLSNAAALELWNRELSLVGKMLTLDNRNFHGWGYRRKVVETIDQLRRDASSPQQSDGDPKAFLSSTESELDYTSRMIRNDLSNFSAWHARGRLLPRLLNEQNASAAKRDQAWQGEIDLIRNALYTDPYDSSIWAYHSALMDMLDCSTLEKSVLGTVSSDRQISIVEGELEVIWDLLEDTKDCKWLLEALLRLSLRQSRLQGGSAPNREQLKEQWQQLIKLDPLRKGRWHDWAKDIGIQIER